MKPYYSHSGIEIYHGRCEEVIPALDLRADLLLTDPPYGIGRDGQRQSTGGHGGRKGFEHKGWDAVRPPRDTFDLLLSRCNASVIWGGNYFADLLPPSGKWFVWDKDQRINQSDGELAWTSLSGALRIFNANRVILMQDGTYHPTQKPVALMKWCIAEMLKSAPHKTVLDPFCGGGATLMASKDFGLSAIGIEQDESYCETTAVRLAQEVLFA